MSNPHVFNPNATPDDEETIKLVNLSKPDDETEDTEDE